MTHKPPKRKSSAAAPRHTLPADVQTGIRYKTNADERAAWRTQCYRDALEKITPEEKAVILALSEQLVTGLENLAAESRFGAGRPTGMGAASCLELLAHLGMWMRQNQYAPRAEPVQYEPDDLEPETGRA